MGPAYDNECGRCNSQCRLQEIKGVPGKLKLEDEVIDYGDLLVDVGIVLELLPRVEGYDDVADATRRFARLVPLEGDVYNLYRRYLKYVTCFEYLAIYCRDKDVIYYNWDRIAGWVTRLYLANLGTFMLQLVKSGLNGNQRLGMPFDLVKRVAARVTRDVALAYLTAHERYHWAGRASKPQSEEEALATAFGIQKAYEHLTNMSDQGALISFLEARARGGPGRYGADDVMHVHAHVHGAKPLDFSAVRNYVLATSLAHYFGHLTLARLFYEHLHMPDYSGFIRYLSDVIRPPGLVVEVGKRGGVRLFVRSEMRGSNRETVAGSARVDLMVESEIRSDLRFTGEARPARRELREEYKFCEREVDVESTPWSLKTELIAEGNYLVDAWRDREFGAARWP